MSQEQRSSRVRDPVTDIFVPAVKVGGLTGKKIQAMEWPASAGDRFTAICALANPSILLYGHDFLRPKSTHNGIETPAPFNKSRPQDRFDMQQLTIYAGGAGFIIGGTSGVLKGTTPVLFALASGIQTFTLGTVFWASRGAALQAWQTSEDYTRRSLTAASTFAGGLSGGLAAQVFRGRSNVLPAVIMWSLFGCTGQIAANAFSSPREQQSPKESVWMRLAKSEWSPVKVMSDEEYAEKLRKDMLKLDIEISILDDRMSALKEQEQGQIKQPDATGNVRPLTYGAQVLSLHEWCILQAHVVRNVFAAKQILSCILSCEVAPDQKNDGGNAAA